MGRVGRRTVLAALGAAIAWSLAACTAERERVVTVKLEVSDTGMYVLDGVPTPTDDLKHALRAKRPQEGTLLVHVDAAPGASVEAVRAAVQAAQFAGAQVGVVGNERF